MLEVISVFKECECRINFFLSFQVVHDTFVPQSNVAKVKQAQVKELNGVLSSLRSKILIMGMDPVQLKEERDKLDKDNNVLRRRLEVKEA